MGDINNVVGGIIMLFFLIISLVVAIGFLVNYFLFNSNTVSNQIMNPSLDRALKTSFLFRVNIFMSKFMDISQPNMKNLDNDTEDLCKNNKIKFKVSRYFSHVRNMNEKFQ